MSNLISVTDQAALANFANAISEEVTDGVQYLKFTKQGEFVYGMEENVVDEEEQFAANMSTWKKGWICWKDGGVAGEEMALVSTGRTISRQELPDYGPYSKDSDGWKEQASIEFENLDTGETLLFKASSHGGRQAIAALAKQFMDRIKRGHMTVVPVVCMTADSYKHKDYGKINKPVFEVIDWVGASIDEDEPPFEVEAEEAAPIRTPAELVDDVPTKKAPRKKARRTLSS